MNSGPRFHRTNFLVLLGCLTIIVIGMMYIVYLTTNMFEQIENESTRSQLYHLALVASVGMSVGLMGMLWITVRWMRYALVLRRETDAPTESQYVDAWSEAGKRIEVPHEDELEE